MRIVLPILAAGLTACLAATPALANINVYYHAGAWDAFDGQASNGQPLCGLGSQNPADGRSISITEQIGSDATTFLAHKPGWNIPAATRIPVVVQIGLQRPWVAQATGNGDKVEWTMDQADAAAFDAQFRGAESMTVTFPSGNETPWIIALNGSTAASNAMRRCIADLARRSPAPAPSAAAAAPGQPTTQPFAPSSDESNNAGSAQPAQADQSNPGAAPPATH